MGVPRIPNIEPLIAAGIDPKTGLPIKFSGSCATKADIKKALRIIDEQDAVNRYVWYNLPCNLTSAEVERLLYYKGQLCFFYNKEDDKFYFMPYALDGTIDFYGRFNRVHPVPITSGTEEEKTKRYKDQLSILSQMKLKCVYGVLLDEEMDEDTLTNSCVLIHDYQKQLSQTIIPRQIVNDPILDVMADCIPYMDTALMIATGIKGMRVNSQDEQANVINAGAQVKEAALTGNPFTPVIGQIEFQELTDGQVAKAEEYMLAMQSLDNFRLSTYGIDNGGLFEKKAYENDAATGIQGGPVGLVLQDGLSIRQNFCNIVNSIWGINIWCEPAQNVMGMDMDGDGAMYDDNADGQNTGVDTGEGGKDNASNV